MPVVKIAAILGLMVAGITVTIFMSGGGGPCDPIVNDIPPFSSSRGEGLGSAGSAEAGLLNWVRDIKCGLSKPSGSSSERVQSSPPVSTTQSVVDSSASTSSGRKRLKAVFSFWDNHDRNYGSVIGSLRKSFKIEIINNGTTENLFDWLPMQIVLKADNKRAWENYITKESCNEDLRRQYCIVPFYKYNSAWDGKKLLMQVYDNKGELLEIHYEE